MGETSLDFAVIVFGLISTVILVMSYVPMTLKSLIKRQTYGISLYFNLLICFACFVWVIYGSLSLIETPYNLEDGLEKRLISALPILISNVILLVLNIISLLVKLSMIYQAKKHNITEKEYCDLYNSQKMKKLESNK